MKTSLVAVVLAVTAMAVGQAAAPQSPAQPAPAQQPQQQPQTQQPQTQQPQQPQAQQQKKEIKDPAEYNAYVGAVQQADAAAAGTCPGGAGDRRLDFRSFRRS